MIQPESSPRLLCVPCVLRPESRLPTSAAGGIDALALRSSPAQGLRRALASFGAGGSGSFRAGTVGTYAGVPPPPSAHRGGGTRATEKPSGQCLAKPRWVRSAPDARVRFAPARLEPGRASRQLGDRPESRGPLGSSARDPRTCGIALGSFGAPPGASRLDAGPRGRGQPAHNDEVAHPTQTTRLDQTGPPSPSTSFRQFSPNPWPTRSARMMLKPNCQRSRRGRRWPRLETIGARGTGNQSSLARRRQGLGWGVGIE
jgi:hypothetical protein